MGLISDDGAPDVGVGRHGMSVWGMCLCERLSWPGAKGSTPLVSAKGSKETVPMDRPALRAGV